jgi:hypothetical protein
MQEYRNAEEYYKDNIRLDRRGEVVESKGSIFVVFGITERWCHNYSSLPCKRQIDGMRSDKDE